MPCRTHPSINGVNTCNQCGEWLCEECTVEINGRIFCRGCLASLAGKPGDSKPSSAIPGRRISGGLLFFLSFFMPSGVNYMYMGLMKRGLAAMVGFFLLIYLASIFSMWPFTLIFGLSIPIFWLTCIFDGFNIRRRINSGIRVTDDVDDIINFIKRNKHLIIAFFGLLLVLTFAGSMFSVLANPIRRALPVLVVALGLYVLFKRPNRP